MGQKQSKKKPTPQIQLNIVDYIAKYVQNLEPTLDPFIIYTVATYVVNKKSYENYHRFCEYYHGGFVLETIKICKLKKNILFIVNMVKFKIRLKKVVSLFKERYYQPPDETNPKDKGGAGYQNHFKHISNSVKDKYII